MLILQGAGGGGLFGGNKPAFGPTTTASSLFGTQPQGSLFGKPATSTGFGFGGGTATSTGFGKLNETFGIFAKCNGLFLVFPIVFRTLRQEARRKKTHSSCIQTTSIGKYRISVRVRINTNMVL